MLRGTYLEGGDVRTSKASSYVGQEWRATYLVALTEALHQQLFLASCITDRLRRAVILWEDRKIVDFCNYFWKKFGSLAES